jgi:hypothetical protein
MPDENDQTEVQPRKPAFSQRYGHTDYPTAVQADSLDERTRADLWNFLIHPFCVGEQTRADDVPPMDAEVVWMEFLARPIHDYHFSPYFQILHDITYKGEWHRVYDLVEFLAQRIGAYRDEMLVQRANQILATNRAGCRIVDHYVVPITNAGELSAINAAVDSPLSNAGEHIKRAVALFAVRENPNFAKAIQEAMSAAESAAQILADRQGVTLGRALTDVQKKAPTTMHPALLEGWKQLYGFTSDSGGVRHALHEGTAPLEAAQDYAQYFIVTCSAFVNLVAAMKANAE